MQRPKGKIQNVSPHLVAIRVRGILVMAFCLLFLCAIACRLAYVQAKYPERFENLSCFENSRAGIIPASRGRIFDSRNRPLVDNRTVFRLFVNPSLVPDELRNDLINGLVRELDVDPEWASVAVNRRDSTHQVLVSDMSREQIERFENLSCTGEEGEIFREVGVMEIESRVYPEGSIAGPVLGFTGTRDTGQVGLWGLESCFNDLLSGTPGEYADLRDQRGRRIPGSRIEVTPPLSGSDIYLTVNADIQALAESALQDGIDRTGARGGTAIITEPLTGEVRALVSLPAVDPANFGEYLENEQALFSSSTCLAYEPGSVMKVFTIAAGLEDGVIARDSILHVTNGPLYFSGKKVRDHEYPAPDLSIYDIIVHSSNRGSALVALELGYDALLHHLKDFGFGTRTCLSMPAEPSGNLKENFPRIYEIDLATMGFGHGITVTPLQIVQAMSVFANEGTLVPLRLIDRIVPPTGNPQVTPAGITRSVISSHTANIVEEFMVGVVEEGTAMQAASNWPCAGKTGTAHKVNPEGGYFEDVYYSTFVGYGPLPDPQWMILVILDEPVAPYYGGAACGPVFREIFNGLMLRDSGTFSTISSTPAISDSDVTVVESTVEEEVLTLGEYVINHDPFQDGSE